MLRQILVIASLVFAAQLAQAGEAGKVIYVAGTAHMADQTVVLGAPVQEGVLLTTGADGYLYVKTIDNGLFILRPNTKARIVTYHVDTQNPANTHIKLELLSGIARSRSGEAVKLARQNFRFNTPVAAIGVRGTDFTVFTDQDISRVTVISGGITVSGFGGACRPEGGGPCEGNASRDLSATQTGQLLQIQRGQAAPQLLQGSVVSPPDLTGAPLGKNSGLSNADNLAASEPNLYPQQAGSLEKSDGQSSSSSVTTQPVVPQTPTAPIVVVTPPVTPVVPVAPVVPDSQIVWGRWQPILDQAAEINFVAQKAQNQLVALDGYFALFLTPGQAYVSPVQGSVGFALQNSEAYILNDNAAIAPTAATLQNGQLNVNFGTQTFTTSLNLVNGAQTYALQAQGTVGSNGTLNGNLALARTGYINVAGVLSTENGGAAAYLFDGRITATQTVNGATYWGH